MDAPSYQPRRKQYRKTSRPSGTAKFALIKTRAQRALRTISNKEEIDGFDVINIAGMLTSIIDICEEESPDHE